MMRMGGGPRFTVMMKQMFRSLTIEEIGEI